jgi:hypothetical protein
MLQAEDLAFSTKCPIHPLLQKKGIFNAFSFLQSGQNCPRVKNDTQIPSDISVLKTKTS